MMTQRILIISGSPLCRNPRVLKEATALSEAGYRTTVLTLPSAPRFEEEDEQILSKVAFQKILAIPPALGSLARLLDLTRRARVRLAREACLRLRLSPVLALGPVPPLLRKARKMDWDLAIGHTEPGLWTVTRLLDSGRPVAADIEDWHSQDLLPQDRKARPIRLLEHIERRLLREAAFTLAPSRSMARQLAVWSGARQPLVLHNVFPLRPLPAALLPVIPTKDSKDPLADTLAAMPPLDGETRFVWFSQTVGPGRGLEEFVRAAAQVPPKWSLTLAGDLSDHYRAELLALLPPAQAGRLRFVPRMPEASLHDFLRGFDVGVGLELSSRPNHNLTLTNKVFQYMNAGLALLLSRTKGQEELCTRWPAVAWLADPADGAALARCIQNIVTTPAETLARRAAARSAAELSLNWDIEKRLLLRAVEGVFRK